MIPSGERWYGTGKRKLAVARVWLTRGTGKIHIRKWRKVPKGKELIVTYLDPKTGELLEEQAQFPDHLKEGEYAVPFTAKAGKKPFRYTPAEEYFGRETLRMVIQQPFQHSKTAGQFDVWANVRGGGLSGQADAIRHGISCALLEFEQAHVGDVSETPAAEGEETTSRTPIRRALKRAGFLTRDARIKERKKYGQPGARKRFQYSKR